jgi:hypothetical protein
LHQLVLRGQVMLHLWVIVVGIVGLTVAMVVPCVHHLRNFGEAMYKYFGIESYPKTISYDFYLSLFK